MPRSGRPCGGRVGRMATQQGEQRDQRNHWARLGKRAVHAPLGLPPLRPCLSCGARQCEVLFTAVPPGAMAATSGILETPILLFALRPATGPFAFAQTVLFQRLPPSGTSTARQNGRQIMTDCHSVTISRQIVTLPATPRRVCRPKRNGAFQGQPAKMAREPVGKRISVSLLTRASWNRGGDTI